MAGHRDPWLGAAGSIDIADPAAGGHVVFAEPGPSDPRQVGYMLTNELEPNPWEPTLPADSSMSWVVGFRDGRAAQVTQLQWVDPAKQRSDPAIRQLSHRRSVPARPWDRGRMPGPGS